MKTTLALMAVILCAAVGNAFDNSVKQSTPTGYATDSYFVGGKIKIEWLEKYDCIKSSIVVVRVTTTAITHYTEELLSRGGYCEEWLQTGLAKDGTLRYRKRKER